VKYDYIIVTATVNSQRDVTRLVQLPNIFHPWTATDCVRECSRHVQLSVMLMPAAVFSPNVCFPESCHTGPCVYDGGRLLNQRRHVAVTALMVFTHVYRVYTLPNTCRPTRTPPVKVRRWPPLLAHGINVRHRELSSVYYIGLPARQTPVTGCLCAILLHSTGDYRPNNHTCWYNKTNSNTNSNFTNKVRILEKNEFIVPISQYRPVETSTGSRTMATNRGSGCAPRWSLLLMMMMKLI